MGVYIGTPIVELLEDGRLLKLTNDFSYKDDAELIWRAPRNAIVDGASIPQALWTFTGGPLEGRYRNASILHDWYCDKRSRGWKSVHRMFHEAMLASGVSNAKAQIMYLAVYYGGPRWSDTTVANATLDPSTVNADGGIFRSYSHDGDERAIKRANDAIPEMPETKPEAYVKDIDLREFETLKALVEAGDRNPEEIEAIVDQRTSHIIN